MHSKKTTVFFSFHVLYSSEHKVGLATLDEPLAVLLHVGVMIAYTTLIPLPIADECDETVGNTCGCVTIDFYCLLAVQMIDYIKQG